MAALSGLLDVTSDIQTNNPQLNVQIDRDKASALGISAQQVETALNAAYGTQQISTIYASTNEYEVILEVKPEFQRDPSALGKLYIHATPTQPVASQSAPAQPSPVPAYAPQTPAGQSTSNQSSTSPLVPLSTVAKLSTSVGPLLVNHLGQLPSATISFNLRPGASLSSATTQVQALAKQTLPSTITTSFQGTAQIFQSSLQNLTLLLLVAIMVIYLVLGILYESFIHPFTILSGLPSAGWALC